jgi:hypothetical protein
VVRYDADLSHLPDEKREWLRIALVAAQQLVHQCLREPVSLTSLPAKVIDQRSVAWAAVLILCVNLCADKVPPLTCRRESRTTSGHLHV